MAVLESASELQEYCLRKLGKPVINIEVAASQLDDRVDEAIELFIQRHYSGVIEVWKKHTITASDVRKGYIKPPSDIVAMVELLDPSSSTGSSSLEAFERLNYRLAQTDFFESMTGGIDAGLLYIKKANIATMLDVLSPDRNFQFNYVKQYLNISGALVEGSWIIIHGYEAIDPDKDVNVYNDEWIKKYTTALIKQQWGQNIKKYTGVQLPGGVEMNGQQTFDEATEEIARLLEEFEMKYEYPVNFFAGPSFL